MLVVRWHSSLSIGVGVKYGVKQTARNCACYGDGSAYGIQAQVFILIHSVRLDWCLLGPFVRQRPRLSTLIAVSFAVNAHSSRQSIAEPAVVATRIFHA